MGGAFGHTGGFESRIQSLHAEITFYCGLRFRIVFRNLPGTDSLAGHAPNTFFLININYRILTFDHCFGRANSHAKWFFAVTARLKDKFRPDNACDFFRRGVAYLAEDGTYLQTLVGFAVHLASVTTDTPAAVKMDHIFIHSSTLLFGLRMLFLTKTKTSQRLTAPPA